MKLLDLLARLMATFAGALLTFITLMTCASLVGRNTTGDSIVGAFELTGVAAGAAIAMFMPLCQARRGNIIVDFFTSGLKEQSIDRLDRFGSLLIGVIFALMAWRTAIGGIGSWRAGSESQIMGFPEWIVYASMVPAFTLAALIALHQVVFGYGDAAPIEDKVV